MGRRAMALSGGALALAAWVGLSAQQEMLPRPGPGSGITPVRLVEEPVVRLANGTEVRVLDPLSVSIRPPSFIAKGRTLEITWSTGEVDRVTVGEVFDGGWISVASESGRYINLGSARSVRTLR
jgi:hypothetical protein